MSNRILSEYRRLNDPVLFCYDGSQHDSHQHHELIKIVDNFFLDKLGIYCMGMTEIPHDMQGRLLKELKRTKT